jgi:hypothetical protein
MILEQLNDHGCEDAPICANSGLTSATGKLKTEWTSQPITGQEKDLQGNSTDCTKTRDRCEYPAFSRAAQSAFDQAVTAVQNSIDKLLNDDPAKRSFQESVNRLRKRKVAIVNSMPAISSETGSAMDTISKDLNQYAMNLRLADGTGVHAVLGNIYDPIFSANPGSSSRHPRKSGASAWTWTLMKFGRQTVFSVNTVNLVDTSAALVPITQKKSIATITAVYADPIFEVSAGAFFSALPNRTFANQTQILQQAGCPDVNPVTPPITTVPTLCDVTIAEADRRPTIVPFAAGNWRLGPDFKWIDGRRGAAYFTTAVGIDPNTTTTEYAAGFSFS